MAFQEIQKGTFGRPAATNRISASVSKATVSISISADIYKQIGSPAFVKMLLGTGSDAGFLAIVPKNMPGKGTYRTFMTGGPSGAACVSISGSKINVPSMRLPTTTLAFEITDDGCVIDIRPLRVPQHLKVAAE